MGKNRYNPEVAKRLYDEAVSIGSSKLSQDDFFNRLNEDGYAEKIYNRYKEKYGVSLIDAPDAQSLRDSLYAQNAPVSPGTESPAEPAVDEEALAELDKKVEIPKKKKERSPFFGVEMPNIDEYLDTEIPQVYPAAPKVPDMELKFDKKQEDPLKPYRKPEKFSDVVGEDIEDRIQRQMSILGNGETPNVAIADDLQKSIDEQLDQYKKENGAFLIEYNSKSRPDNTQAIDAYHEGGPIGWMFAKQSKEDRDWVNSNSAKYQEIQRNIRAMERQKELLHTYRQLAVVDRSVAQGEQLSSMVSNGDITEETMELLRSDVSPVVKEEHISRKVASGEIDPDTAARIKAMGDLTNKATMGQGLFRTGSIKNIATLGLNEISRNIDIVSIANRVRDGIPVTDEERDVLVLFDRLSQMQTEEKSDARGFWYNSGQMLQKSLLFALEMGITGGVEAVGKQLTKKGVKSLVEMAGEQGMKKVLGQVAKNTVQVVGKNVKRQAMLTPLTFSSYVDFSNRIAGLTVNAMHEGKDIKFGDVAKSLYLSYANTFAERFSESFGNIVSDIPMWTILTKGKATREINNAFLRNLSKITNNNAFKTTADFLENVGVQSAPMEMFSELSGSLTNYLLQIPVEGFDNDALKEITPEFFLQVGLQSVIMGGMGTLGKYTVGAMASAVEDKKAQNEFERALERVKAMDFATPVLNDFKEQLIEAMGNESYMPSEDGSASVASLLSEMNEIVASTNNAQDKFVLALADNAVRQGAYRYGQMQAIKSYVEDKIGEYENADGNVYEVADTQGNIYYMLDSTDDAVIVIDRNTGEKSVKRKDYFNEGSIKQTNGSDFALQTFMLNIDRWNAEQQQIANEQVGENHGNAEATYVTIHGQNIPIERYDEATGMYYVLDAEGNEVKINPADEGVELVFEGVPELIDNQNNNNVPEVAETAEQNGVDNTDTDADEQNQAEQAEQIGQQEEIEYDNEGNPVWLSASIERGKQEIDSAFEGDEAKAFVEDKVKEAKKAVKKLENKKPKATNIRDRKLEIEQIRVEKEQAMANLDYWNSMSQLYNAPIEEIVEPVAEPVAIQKTTSDSVLPEGVQPYTVGENIKKRYEESPKVYGTEDTYTDADGNTFKGRWVVVEADGVTASHDPNTLQTSEGFPLTDKGRNVNDNDYSTKRGVVETMAANYDSRALDEPVIVSEGAIVSGNNRTISGQIAAQNGTDAKYKEALPAKSAMRGIPSEELSKFKSPRLVFELAEPIEYTTENFARFNRARNKTKSPVDMAIAIGKQDTSRLVGQILSTIGEVEKLSELYQNQNTVAAIMKQIVESGIINQNEMPQFYTQEYGITDAGKDFIETLLIGSVINEDQIRILNSEGMKQYREKIVSAMLPIANNMKYEDNIGKHLNTAIKYLKEARDAKTDLKGILLDIPLFDAKEYEDLSIFTALMLQRKPTEFREFINNLNQRLELGADNLFGETNNAESVLEDYEQQNKLTDNERETIRLARQERESATQGVSGSVQTDGTDTNTRGEGDNGDSISETEKQSVENGNIEQSGYDNLDESIGNGETGRRGSESNDTGAESYQQPMGGTSDRGVSTNIGEGVPTEEARTTATEAIVETLKESGIEVKIEVETPIDQIENAEYHKVYHGTGAKFDKFDHSHMGEGEGNQAFGWGSYVTEVEGIGRTYAKDIARNGKRVYLDGNDITDLIPKVPSSIHSPSVFAAAFMLRYKDGARNAIQEHLNGLNTTFGSISEQANPKLYNAYKQAIQTAEEAIKVIDNSKFEVKETTPTLYTIEIPDDNGSNYLNWSEVIEDKDLDVLLDKISEATKDDESFDFDEFSEQLHKLSDYGNILGEDLYFTLSRHGYGTNHKAASQLLSQIGFIGVSYPAQFRTGGRADGAKNYVIFNENDLQIKDRIEFMKTPNGTIYGWTVGGEIFLTKDGFNPDTPIHEYTHIWANAMKQKNPKGWASIKNLLKDTPVWNEVVNDENYSNIRNNEDSVASEVLSRISGSKNAEKMEQEAQRIIDEANGSIGKARAQELVKRMKEALNKFWNWVGTELFKIESFESVEQVADRILYDLLNRTSLGGIEESSPIEFSIIPDGKLKDKLQQEIDNGEYITLYRAARKINGKYYSPKMSKLGGVGQEIVLGELEQSDERPDLAYPVKMKDGSIKYKVDLDGSDPANSGLKKRNTNGVDYNPYIHASDSMMNDQFTAAFDMPEMVVLEVRVPKSELTSGYKADKAAESVGQKPWKSGTVDGKLPKNEQRKVYLSRYDMPVREVPTDEIADHIATKLLRNNLSMPYNLVTPQVAEALLKRGVDVSEIPSGKVPAGQNEKFAELKDRILKENNIINRNTEGGRTAEQKQALFDKAKEIFGTTNNFKVAGYMLPDGSLLDFSGRWEGGPRDARYTDHRAIGSGLYEASETDSNYDTNMYDFINQGAIRLMPESAGIYVSQPLTDAQEEMLARYIARYNGEVILDITDKDGNIISYIEYNRRTSANRVLDDISNYFDKGIVPTQPEIRYRIPSTPAEARQRAENIMKDAIAPMAAELGVEVNYVTSEDISDVEPGARKKRQSKGWYQDGKVYINLSTHETIDDAKETYLHEVVAHYGLRGLLKDQFEPVMQKVFASLTPTQQQSLLEIFADEVEAAEEFLASMAENDIDPTIVEKVIGFIREALRSMGINLDSYTDGDMQYLLWRSKNSLKENAGNVETARWEAKDAEVRYRTVGRPANYLTNDLEMTAKDKFLHKIQDRMRPVTRLIREIEQRGGRINEASDVHSQEFLSASRASGEMEDFNFNKLTPLVDSFAQAMKVFAEKMGMVREDAEKAVYDYLYAKHAIERNKKICMDEMLDAAKKGIAPDKVKLMDADFIAELGKVAEQLYDNQFNGGTNLINPNPALTAEQNKLLIVLAGKMQKEAGNISRHFETDASGKSVYIGNNRSGMNDVEAKQLLNKLYTPQTSGALDDVSAKVKVCTDFTLDKWLEYGLISQAEYNEYKARYNNYIPLRGWEEKGDNTDYASILNSHKNSGGLLDLNRQAKGRWSKADNPIAHIQSMAQSACITGNRNLIRRKAFNLVMQNEGIMSDLATFEYTYEVYDDNGNLDYTTPIKPEQSLFDEGKVKAIRDKSYEWHKTSAEIDTHVVSVFINGDRHNFVFKGTLGGQVATAVKGNENKTTGIIKQLLAKGTRAISANLTARNVYFLSKNLMRDLGFGNFAYFVENGKFINPAVYAGAMKTAAMDAMHAEPSSIKDYDLYQEFKLNGGQTGYVQLKDIDNLKKDFDKLLKDATANDGFVVRNGKEMWDTLTMTFDVMGKASENAMRFAVYKMERQRGASPREAAIRAKEITVNFNRQGVDTKGWSAAYAFFNPAVQGAYRYAKLLKKHPGRFVIATAALMAMKFGLGVICEMFSGGDDEPDGESAYDRLSDYVKATNWVIPLSWMPGEGNDDKFLCIPLPQSVRASTHLSDCAVDILFGRKDFGEALKDAALFAAGEFLPFDIDAIDVEGKRFIPSLVQSAMPTIARPLYEAYVSNRDFMGNPISKEPFLRDQDYIPQSELAFGSTSPILVGATKFLNKLAGGDDYRSAGLQITQNGQVVESALGNFMDVNPARLEHLFSGYFGGVFKPVVDTWTTMSSFVDEDVELTAQSAVLVNQFIKGPTSKPGYKTYYRMRDENDDIVNAVNIYKDKPEYSEDYKRLISNRYNHEVVEYYKTYSEIVKNLNESIALIKTNSASVEDHKEKIAELEAQRDALILEAATVYRDICKRRDNDN